MQACNVALSTFDLFRQGFGIKDPSPVQIAIMFAMDGLPLGALWDDENVRTVFGGTRPPAGAPGDPG
jgi:hypothetical protein